MTQTETVQQLQLQSSSALRSCRDQPHKCSTTPHTSIRTGPHSLPDNENPLFLSLVPAAPTLDLPPEPAMAYGEAGQQRKQRLPCRGEWPRGVHPASSQRFPWGFLALDNEPQRLVSSSTTNACLDPSPWHHFRRIVGRSSDQRQAHSIFSLRQTKENFTSLPVGPLPWTLPPEQRIGAGHGPHGTGVQNVHPSFLAGLSTRANPFRPS